MGDYVIEEVVSTRCLGVQRLLEIMYEKRLLILAHQAYHLLPCPMNCLFEKYESSYGLRRKMTFKLPRPKTDMFKKLCSYKSIIR